MPKNMAEQLVRSNFRPHIMPEFVAVWGAALFFSLIATLPTTAAEAYQQLPAAVVVAATSALLAAIARFVIGCRAVGREVLLATILGLVVAIIYHYGLAGSAITSNLTRFLPVIIAAAIVAARIIKYICPICRKYD